MSDSEISFPDGPRVHLDDRLMELVHAANEVLAAQGRMRMLLRASQRITADLDLDSVLQGVVDAAGQLTGARAVALGVLGADGRFDRVVRRGPDVVDIGRLGRSGEEGSPLAVLIAGGRPVHVPGEAAPAMLGVPIPIRGVVSGVLLLQGHPAGRFTDEDEQLLQSLTATAGFAVENARLNRETRYRERWAAASVEITARLLSPEQGSALPLIAARTRELADAMSAYVVVGTDDPEQLRVVEVGGEDPTGARGALRRVQDTLAGEVLRSGRAQRYGEQALRALGRPDLDPFGPVLALPLTTGSGTIGAVLVARAAGRPAFTDVDLTAAADFAGRAGVALELAQAREQAQRTLLVEDRRRIARDLHDRVIQQLFATGMQLQRVLSTLPPGRRAELVDAAVTSLDAAITQIRRIIAALRTEGGPAPAPARLRLFEVVERRSATLSIEPEVLVTGPIDAVLDGDLAEDVLAAVEEGITDVACREGCIAVEVAADADGVTVIVSNDGVAPVEVAARADLHRLEERARRRRGSLSLAPVDGRTVLTWHVPLRLMATG
ncbi:GAF domain-containing protein [Amnibacterium sp.]|uniref:GAF domain-containing sensor histidine kinase n=1 Tax=Amnibacterium sp. TaxID=1872496 RepID=UPI003F7C5157